MKRFGAPPSMLAAIHQFHEGMRAWVRLGRRQALQVVLRQTGPSARCVLETMLFNISWTAVLNIALAGYRLNANIVADTVRVGARSNWVGAKACPKAWGDTSTCVGHAVPDDEGVVSRSSSSLKSEYDDGHREGVCGVQTPGVKRPETEVVCWRRSREKLASLRPERYTNRDAILCTSDGSITDPPDLTVEYARQVQRAWGCHRRYSQELYDQTTFSLNLKARMPTAEIVQTLFLGK